MTLAPDLVFLALIGIAAAVGLFLQWRDRRKWRADIDRRITRMTLNGRTNVIDMRKG